MQGRNKITSLIHLIKRILHKLYKIALTQLNKKVTFGLQNRQLLKISILYSQNIIQMACKTMMFLKLLRSKMKTLMKIFLAMLKKNLSINVRRVFSVKKFL